MLPYLDFNHTVNKELAKDKEILASLIVMGSNFNADVNLTKALELLSKLEYIKEIKLINTHSSTDYKNLSKSIYFNQGLLIEFNDKVLLSDFIGQLKSIEKACGRMPNLYNQVALDIDVLAIGIYDWVWIAERLPLKPYEILCLTQKN